MCSLSLQHFISVWYEWSGHAYGRTDTFTQNHIPDPNKVIHKIAFLTALGFCYDLKFMIRIHHSALKQRCHVQLDFSYLILLC